MTAPFMQLYPGDYHRDTQHLTTLEHGAYLLILMALWARGGTLPHDERTLMRIAKLQPSHWRRIAPTILEFFSIEAGLVATEKRVTKELGKYHAMVEKRRHAGALGGRAKSLKTKEPVVASDTISATATRTRSHKAQHSREGRAASGSRSSRHG